MPNLPDTLCYLDGNYTPLNQAKVSVLDRGFLFGDGVYEVVPVYGRGLFRFEEHMARLERSLAKVRIANPHTAAEWLARCRRLIESHVAEDQLIAFEFVVILAEAAILFPGVAPQGLLDRVNFDAAVMSIPWPDEGTLVTSKTSIRWERLSQFPFMVVISNDVPVSFQFSNGCWSAPQLKNVRVFRDCELCWTFDARASCVVQANADHIVSDLDDAQKGGVRYMIRRSIQINRLWNSRFAKP